MTNDHQTFFIYDTTNHDSRANETYLLYAHRIRSGFMVMASSDYVSTSHHLVTLRLT